MLSMLLPVASLYLLCGHVMHAIDEQTCPLCSQPNGCAVVLGKAPEQCWCMQTQIDPHVLAQPKAVQALQKRCVCQVCAQAEKVKN